MGFYLLTTILDELCYRLPSRYSILLHALLGNPWQEALQRSSHRGRGQRVGLSESQGCSSNEAPELKHMNSYPDFLRYHMLRLERMLCFFVT